MTSNLKIYNNLNDDSLIHCKITSQENLWSGCPKNVHSKGSIRVSQQKTVITETAISSFSPTEVIILQDSYPMLTRTSPNHLFPCKHPFSIQK